MSLWKRRKISIKIEAIFFFMLKFFKLTFLSILGFIAIILISCMLLVLYDYIYIKTSNDFRFERFSNSEEFLELDFINKDANEIIDLMQKAGAHCSAYKVTTLDKKTNPKSYPYNAYWSYTCEYNSRMIGWNGFMQYRIFFDFDANKQCISFYPIIYRIYI